MPTYSTYDITKDGGKFIPEVLKDTTFQNNGVLYGDNADVYWAVVDPERHPLYVWGKKGNRTIGAYAKAAKALGAVVFTNGPMMEPPNGLSAVQNYLLYGAGTLLASVVAAVVGFYAAAWQSLGGLAPGGFIGGAIVGLVWGRWIVAKIVFSGASPMGAVYGKREGITDPGNDLAHSELFYLGRDTDAFSSYKVGPSPTPKMTEVIGGLIPLVLNFAARSIYPTTPTGKNPLFDQGYANWVETDGYTAWGLVPFGDRDSPVLGSYQPPKSKTGDDPLAGVIVAVGHDTMWFSRLRRWAFGPGAYMAALAPMLVSIGVRDAVVMDAGDSVMMGDHDEMMFGPPPADKDVWEIYGFCCI